MCLGHSLDIERNSRIIQLIYWSRRLVLKTKDLAGWAVALIIGLSSGWLGASAKIAATEARVGTLSTEAKELRGRVTLIEEESKGVSSQLSRIETQVSNAMGLLEGLVDHNVKQADDIKNFYQKYGVPLDKIREDMLRP